ncbi:MAG: ABC transporter permease [Lachnospiraceae bacterium]|nr:ABC transporter permease [Lachnospiraceae bacterium]
MELATLFNAMPGNIAQGLLWGIMALGVYLTFKVLNFADLTVDGSFATGGAVAVVLITGGVPAPIALMIAFFAGVVAGFATGILHTVFGIPDILAGILTQIALYSINLNIMSGSANMAVNVLKYNLVVTLREIPHTIIISLISVAVIIGLMYWYLGTAQGSALRATGNNPAMSRAQGININLMKVIALALSNGLVALAGGMVAQYQGFSDINMGRGAIVIGLAAVIIGEVIGNAIFGKKMNFVLRLSFVVVGAVIYYIVIGVVLWLNMPTNDLKLFTAIIVAIFLAIPYLKGQARSSFRKAGKGAR